MPKENYPEPEDRAQDTLRRWSELVGAETQGAVTVQDEESVEFIHADSDLEFQVLYMARRLTSAIANKEFGEDVSAEAQLVINKYVAFDSFRQVLSQERKAAEVEKFVAKMLPFVEMLNNPTAGATPQS